MSRPDDAGLTDWAETLDAFERRLDAQWRAYRDGLTEPVAPFEPPSDASPLPSAFAARARELVERCRALEDTLAAALDLARSDLERLDRTTATAPPAEPMYFDSRV